MSSPDLSLRTLADLRLPIAAFAMLGFEHSIANQFLLPMAAALCHKHAADGGPPAPAPCLTGYEIVVGNLIPATIGNWVGGAVCVATVYALSFGRPSARISAWAAEALAAWRGRCIGRGRCGAPKQGAGGRAEGARS